MNKNKSTKSMKGSKRPSTYKTRNGVYKTPAGTYQARKCIDGVKVSATFDRMRDAFNWLATL